MRRITHLVLHCSGSDHSTVKSMTRFHLSKGWRTIGYHVVGLPDGSTHRARADRQTGAGVVGFNGPTLHYCLVGDLNAHPPTDAQHKRAVLQFAEWCRTYHLDPLVAVLGHRETGPFVPKWLRTKKPCPGTKVDMTEFRSAVLEALDATA